MFQQDLKVIVYHNGHAGFYVNMVYSLPTEEPAMEETDINEIIKER